MMAGERSTPAGYVDIHIQPGETVEQFAERVVATAPVLSSEIQARLRQLLPPVRRTVPAETRGSAA